MADPTTQTPKQIPPASNPPTSPPPPRGPIPQDPTADRPAEATPSTAPRGRPPTDNQPRRTLPVPNRATSNLVNNNNQKHSTNKSLPSERTDKALGRHINVECCLSLLTILRYLHHFSKIYPFCFCMVILNKIKTTPSELKTIFGIHNTNLLTTTLPASTSLFLYSVY